MCNELLLKAASCVGKNVNNDGRAVWAFDDLGQRAENLETRMLYERNK